MNPARMSFVLVVVLVAFAATLSRADEDTKDTKSNPYESIAVRNPFQLKDPPPPLDPNALVQAPPPPLATVEVTGVLNMLSKKLALLEIVPGPGKPPIKPTLTEGERVESVEVLFIDVDEGIVKINNGGVITNIALKVAKPSTGPGVPGLHPGIPQPGLANPTAGIVPQVVNPIAGSPNAGTYNNSRGNVMVVGGAGPTATPTAAGVPGAIARPYGAYGAAPTVPGTTPTYNAGGVNVSGGGATVPGGVNVSGGGELPRQIPTRPIRGAQPQGTTSPEQVRNDPAPQYINMAIQKQQMESRGRPMPPLPIIPGFDPNQ